MATKTEIRAAIVKLKAHFEDPGRAAALLKWMNECYRCHRPITVLKDGKEACRSCDFNEVPLELWPDNMVNLRVGDEVVMTGHSLAANPSYKNALGVIQKISDDFADVQWSRAWVSIVRLSDLVRP